MKRKELVPRGMTLASGVVYVFTDGGIASPNPSEIGGAFSCRIVAGNGTPGGEVLFEGGLTWSAEQNEGPVTSPVMELYAICYGATTLDSIWDSDKCPEARVIFCPDNSTALGWLLKNYQTSSLNEMALQLLRRGKKAIRNLQDIGVAVQGHLIAGHPTGPMFDVGYRVKEGKAYDISWHNQWCDRKCGDLMTEAFPKPEPEPKSNEAGRQEPKQDACLPDEPRPKILVFGSNLRGIHGKGSALEAKRYYAARDGVGKGPTGMAYAFPTKMHPSDKVGLPLYEIAAHAEKFIQYAEDRDDRDFLLVAVGTGEAGYSDEEIAPLFQGVPSNVLLPRQWEPLMSGHDAVYRFHDLKGKR